MKPTMPEIRAVDPQGEDALALLREAAIDARALYPELHRPNAPWPTNPPNPPRGAYLVAYVDGQPTACGALRPVDADCAEVRRMYVLKQARRGGLASAMLRALEAEALARGFSLLRLETGMRQLPAIALYRAHGFVQIAPFGDYANDPTSVCFEKQLAAPIATA
jgi:GNAT superfamily N-acetyltransferase